MSSPVPSPHHHHHNHDKESNSNQIELSKVELNIDSNGMPHEVINLENLSSTVRIDKYCHIHPPRDPKEIRSNSKLRVSHYLQASSPSIQPNIAKSEPILDIDDDESAKKKEIRRYLDSLNITPALDSKQLSPNLSNIKQYKVEDAAYLPKINDTDPDISDIRLEIIKKHVAKLL